MELKTLEEVREFFKNDTFATVNGAVIDEIGDNYAKCSIKINDNHKNAVGGVMGGVHFMLADFTFAVASNWQRLGSVSLNSNITFLSTVKGTRLIAEAKCVKEGKNTNCYQIDVFDDLGNNVALVNITGFRKN